MELNDDGQLTEMTSSSIKVNRAIYVFDTDYDNYQVYYGCSIITIDNEKRKIGMNYH